jgi:hypothetical protein
MSDLNETFRIEMSYIEAMDLMQRHPDAANDVFTRAADRQRNELPKGLGARIAHKLNMWFDDGYRDRWRDNNTVQAIQRERLREQTERREAVEARVHKTMPEQRKEQQLSLPPLRALDHTEQNGGMRRVRESPWQHSREGAHRFITGEGQDGFYFAHQYMGKPTQWQGPYNNPYDANKAMLKAEEDWGRKYYGVAKANGKEKSKGMGL